MSEYTAEELRRVFQKPFNRDTWKVILHNLFGATQLRTQSEPIPDCAEAEKGYYLGAIDTSDKYRIGLFYYEITNASVAHRKVGLRNLVRKFINQTWGEFDAAIVVFNDKKEWRLSFICDIKDVATAPRRFTFVFGEHDNYYRTPIERFANLQRQERSFKNIREAFSVEALSDDFFNRYRELYADFVQYITGKRYVKQGSEWKEQKIADANDQLASTFDNDEKLVRDYIKKMFGRIVFLYFLQRKGWLNGNRNYMHDLFANSDKKDDFLDGVLEPLFFEVLNTDKPYRTVAAQALPGSDNIPYLNGGLFERDDVDPKLCKFPAEFFEKLFGFLDSYNFTIDENEADDAEVGIDPEMLGRIFENLLEDNKDKGTYYTPKEIVAYMCRESIIAYLKTTLPRVAEEPVRKLVERYDAADLNEKEMREIRRKLQAVKICDPAIGSGAFPMGLVNLLSKLYVAMKADTDTKKMKRHIMEQNIYGVDIDRGAVDIARLRFWLAMIVEETEPMPLPNLHFKIMQGNSLLESYDGIDLSDLTKTNVNRTLFDSDDSERERLVSSLKSYYKTTDHQNRAKLFNEIINNVRRQLYDKQVTVPTGFDLSANSKFFLWHTWFTDVFADGGFDIVIGNPPYIQLQRSTGIKGWDKKGREYDMKFGDLYVNSNYKTFAKTGDIYCLFYELGDKILKEKGHLCYITSNKWMRARYGEALRKYFAIVTNPELLIDFAGIQIFDNVTVDTNILLYSKNNNRHETLCASGTKADKHSVLKNLSDFVWHNSSVTAFTSSDPWVILSPIEQSIKRKIEAAGTPLKDWNIQINYGIKTGCNEAFIISTEKRDEILANCRDEDERKRTEELIRPILRGRDIRRYSYDWAGLYLIATFPSRHYDIEEYPAVKEYLLSFGKERLEQTGKEYIIDGKRVKARKKTNNKWFETQDSIGYWEDFFKPKIIYMEIQTDNPENGYPFPCFSFDENDAVVLNTAYIMCGDKDEITYILGVLNSSVGRYIAKYYVTQLQQRQFRMLAQYVGNFPIPKVVTDEMRTVSKLVCDHLENLTNNDNYINEAICHLYGLDENEISYIEQH